jgi:hypothetical protein
VRFELLADKNETHAIWTCLCVCVLMCESYWIMSRVLKIKFLKKIDQLFFYSLSNKSKLVNFYTCNAALLMINRVPLSLNWSILLLFRFSPCQNKSQWTIESVNSDRFNTNLRFIILIIEIWEFLKLDNRMTDWKSIRPKKVH